MTIATRVETSKGGESLHVRAMWEVGSPILHLHLSIDAYL